MDSIQGDGPRNLSRLNSARGHARIFKSFIDQTLESRSQLALCDAMSSAAHRLGLHNFAYINLSPQTQVAPTLVSTYPAAWRSRYLQERYEQHDPVIMRARIDIAPFDWGGDVPATMSAKGREIFEEAALYGIRYGFSIPVANDAGVCAAVSFATDERRPSFEACIGEHGAVLQFMAMLFHRHVRDIAATGRKIGDVTLSPREFQCLEWTSRGKSAWEIGRILNISRGTVAFHLANAKKKIGVRTINQAVAAFVASRSSCSS